METRTRTLTMATLLVVLATGVALGQDPSGRWRDSAGRLGELTVERNSKGAWVRVRESGMPAAPEAPQAPALCYRFTWDNLYATLANDESIRTFAYNDIDDVAEFRGEFQVGIFDGNRQAMEDRLDVNWNGRAGQSSFVNRRLSQDWCPPSPDRAGVLKVWGRVEDQDVASPRDPAPRNDLCGSSTSEDTGSQHSLGSLREGERVSGELELSGSDCGIKAKYTIEVVRGRATQGGGGAELTSLAGLAGQWDGSGVYFTRGPNAMHLSGSTLTVGPAGRGVPFERLTGGGGGGSALALLGGGGGGDASGAGGMSGTWYQGGTPVEIWTGVDHAVVVMLGGNVIDFDMAQPGPPPTFAAADGTGVSLTQAFDGTLRIEGQGMSVALGRSPGQAPGAIAAGGAPASATTSEPLFAAISRSDVNEVDRLIRLGIDVNSVDAQGRTGLHHAVAARDTATITRLLSAGANAYVTDQRGLTPAAAAVQAGDRASLEALGAGGVPLNDPNLLQQAAQQRNFDMASFLLDRGADANTILSTAEATGNVEFFESVASRPGARVDNAMFVRALDGNRVPNAMIMLNRPELDKNQALVDLLARNALALVPPAIDAGADPALGVQFAVDRNDPNLTRQMLVYLTGRGMTPSPAHVQTAARNGSVPVLRELLAVGGDPNSGLPIAVERNDGGMVQYLVAEAGAFPLPEHVARAAAFDNPPMVQVLLRGGAPGDPGMGPAIENGNNPLVEMLLNEGNPPADPRQAAYVQAAALKGNAGVVGLLLSRGANPNDGMSSAIDGGSTQVVTQLLDGGANATDPSLIAKAAMWAKKTPIVELLLDRGADPQQGLASAVDTHNRPGTRLLLDRGADGTDPGYIVRAAAVGFADGIRMLLDAGASIEATDNRGWPLISLAAATNGNAVRALLDAGADVGAVTPDGYPLMHIAVNRKAGFNASDQQQAEVIGVVETLIAAGADVNALDPQGRTPLKVAKGNKVEKLIKQAGGVKKAKNIKGGTS